MKIIKQKNDSYLAKFLILLVAVLALFLMVHQVSADVIEYCDVEGENLHFVDIVENSLGDSALFGQPSASGDQLLIPTFGFNAVATDGFTFRQGLMQMNVMAKPGQQLNSINLTEFGTFFLFGDDTTAKVNTSAFVIADGEMYDANSLFETEGTGSGNWSQNLSVNFPETDEILLVINSHVFASAAQGQLAFVSKDGLMLSAGTVTAIPEPAMVSGIASFVCMALVFGFRRKQRMPA